VTPWVLQGVEAVILRYGVDRFTPNCAAISRTGTSLERSRVRIVFSSLGLSFFGRPPLRPRARAAFKPACVRSRIRLRSNSASAPKTWNTSCPVGDRVSICSVSEANPTPRAFQLVGQVNEVAEAAAQAVRCYAVGSAAK
jgi:hypothetical protein